MPTTLKMEPMIMWVSTTSLRWQRLKDDFNADQLTLQQLWQGDNGTQEWRDIEIETMPD